MAEPQTPWDKDSIFNQCKVPRVSSPPLLFPKSPNGDANVTESSGGKAGRTCNALQPINAVYKIVWTWYYLSWSFYTQHSD